MTHSFPTRRSSDLANNSENASKREFRPIFNSTITPQSIETLQTSKSDNYLKMTGATVAFKDKSQERTVMVFGKSVADVEALLETGKPVELAVQFDGGSVHIVGQVRAAVAAARWEEHTSGLPSLMPILYPV